MGTTTPQVLMSIAITLVMVVAMFWDLKERRIPNWVTVGALALALAFRVLPGYPPVMEGLLGAGVAFLITFPLFAMGGFGGGDAKLLIAAGAFLGTKALLLSLLVVGIVGGLLAFITALRRGVILPVLFSTRDLLLYLATLGKKGEIRTIESPGAITIPYGVAIAAGALTAWFLPMTNWL